MAGLRRLSNGHASKGQQITMTLVTLYMAGSSILFDFYSFPLAFASCDSAQEKLRIMFSKKGLQLVSLER